MTDLGTQNRAAADEIVAGRPGPDRTHPFPFWRNWLRIPRLARVPASAVVLVGVVLAALLAPLFAPSNPFDPAQLHLSDGHLPPWTTSGASGRFYLLGTDGQGRDLFSAILYGLRISLFVSASAVAIAALFGVAVGLFSGYCAGAVDAVLMRVGDVQLALPSLLMALIISGIARGFLPPEARDGAAIWVLIAAIALSDWVQFARTVRGIVLVEKEKEYAIAARATGVSPFRILVRHILPNAAGPIIVLAAIGLGVAVMAEATLSFLGIGVAPTTPSLGTLIQAGQRYLYSGVWWVLAFPGLALVLIVLAFNAFGDHLRKRLNPRLR